MPISIRVSPEDGARLNALASKTGRSKAFLVREAIWLYLDDAEEREWANHVIHGWEASGATSRLAAELWAELGV